MKYLIPGTVLVFALKAEMHSLFKYLIVKRTIKQTKKRILYTAVQDDIPITLLQTGIGPCAVRNALDSIPPELKISQVVNAGTCGSLNDKMSPGDLVSPEQVICGWDKTVQIPAKPGPGIKIVNTCITTNYSQNTEEFRIELIDTYHADIVDMEAWTVLAWTEKNKIPTHIIKCVSDRVGSQSAVDSRRHMSLCSQKLAEVLLK